MVCAVPCVRVREKRHTYTTYALPHNRCNNNDYNSQHHTHTRSQNHKINTIHICSAFVYTKVKCLLYSVFSCVCACVSMWLCRVCKAATTISRRSTTTSPNSSRRIVNRTAQFNRIRTSVRAINSLRQLYPNPYWDHRQRRTHDSQRLPT